MSWDSFKIFFKPLTASSCWGCSLYSHNKTINKMFNFSIFKFQNYKFTRKDINFVYTKNNCIGPLFREGGDIGLFIKLVPKVFIFVYSTTLGTTLNFDWFVHLVECSNVSTTNSNIQKE